MSPRAGAARQQRLGVLLDHGHRGDHARLPPARPASARRRGRAPVLPDDRRESAHGLPYPLDDGSEGVRSRPGLVRCQVVHDEDPRPHGGPVGAVDGAADLDVGAEPEGVGVEGAEERPVRRLRVLDGGAQHGDQSAAGLQAAEGLEHVVSADGRHAASAEPPSGHRERRVHHDHVGPDGRREDGVEVVGVLASERPRGVLPRLAQQHRQQVGAAAGELVGPDGGPGGIGMMTAGSMALGASAAGLIGSSAAALAIPVAGIVIAAGILLFAGGFALYSINDDSDLSLWAEQDNLWGTRYLTSPSRQSVVAVADRLVGDQALAVTPSPAFNQEIGRQLQELYKVFFAFDLRVDWNERVYGSRFDFDFSDDVNLHLVTVERKMPGMPLPHGATLTVTIEGLGDQTTIHPVEVDFGSEALAHLPPSEATAIAALRNRAVPVQQLLTAATPADEDERADVRTAGSLVLRLYDPSRVLKLAAAEGGRPVGVTALDLDTVVAARAAYTTVTATITIPLGAGLDPLVITHTHRGW